MTRSRRKLPSLIFAVPIAFALGGCVQRQWASSSGPLSTTDQMMDLEESDRVRRFQRLASLSGIAPPQIDEIAVPPGAIGASRPIPVIRVIFDESVFFDTGSAVPRPGAATALNLIAENMRRDVPDLRITVLGHTDAVGSDASNYELSQRRALDVLQRLVWDGVNPGQLGTVAIGKAQPIASNATAGGRARNRRVEFLISPSEQANLFVVQTRPIDPRLLVVGSGAVRPAAPRSVQFLKPRYSGPADFAETPMEKRQVELAAVRPIPLGSAAAETGASASTPSN